MSSDCLKYIFSSSPLYVILCLYHSTFQIIFFLDFTSNSHFTVVFSAFVLLMEISLQDNSTLPPSEVTDRTVAQIKADADKYKADADKEIAQIKANADKEIAQIKADADREIAKITAETAKITADANVTIAKLRAQSSSKDKVRVLFVFLLSHFLNYISLIDCQDR